MSRSSFTPNFIGIGAPKAGTTWIAKMLAAHPEICLSVPKEIHFFNHRRSFLRSEPNLRYLKGLKWYANHFSHCKPNQIVGEFSTYYLFDPNAAERIKKDFPGVKILVCLRDPIDRLTSHYNGMKYYLKFETRTFEDAMHQEFEYIEQGLYYQQLQYFLKYFSLDSFHFVFFDDIKNNPEKVLKELYGFLGVDDAFLPDHYKKKKNAARSSRYPKLIQWTLKLTFILVSLRMNWVITFLKKLKFNDFIEKITNKKIKYPPISREMIDHLKPYFVEDIVKLETLLNKDLSHWKNK